MNKNNNNININNNSNYDNSNSNILMGKYQLVIKMIILNNVKYNYKTKISFTILK